VRSIEIAAGTIAVDGQPVTGGELRTRLGADAEMVLQLSYLSDGARRAPLLGTADSADSPAPPGAPPSPSIAPPPPVEPPPPPPRRGVRGWIAATATGSALAVTLLSMRKVIDGDVVAVGGR
jgi:hypothetical protein